jgi:hypothetical protein
MNFGWVLILGPFGAGLGRRTMGTAMESGDLGPETGVSLEPGEGSGVQSHRYWHGV